MKRVITSSTSFITAEYATKDYALEMGCTTRNYS